MTEIDVHDLLFMTQQLSSSLIPVFASSGVVHGDTAGTYCREARVANPDFITQRGVFTSLGRTLVHCTIQCEF